MSTSVATKKCTKCNLVKQLTEFGRKASAKSGIHYRCRLCMTEYYVQYYKKNRQRRIDQATTWCKANRQKANAHIAEWARKNPERQRQYHRKSMQRHPETYERNHRRRRARLASVECDPTVLLHTVYQKSDGVCGICAKYVDRDKASVDHIVPISKGGTHTWDNVQLAHLVCNSLKGTKVGIS